MTDFLLGVVGQSMALTVTPIAKSIASALEEARRSAESFIVTVQSKPEDE